MVNLQKLKEKKPVTKTNVSVTLDIELLEKLEKWKDKYEVPKLSPLINEVLWEWYNSELKEENKMEEDT